MTAICVWCRHEGSHAAWCRTVVSEDSRITDALDRISDKVSEKELSIVYIQRDLEAIKRTLDNVLKPFKSNMKSLREENASLRENIARVEEDLEKLMRFISHYGPDDVEHALGLMLDRNRRGWRHFRENWLRRLGML